MRDLARSLLASYQPKLHVGEGLTPAAVMLLFYERDGAEHLLFQVRSMHVEYHKGEISLPGGAQDAEDESLANTALRELHEEVGVHPDHVEVFGRVDDVVTSSGFVVAPYVGAITAPGEYPFHQSNIEMDALLQVPLLHLLDPTTLEETLDARGRLGQGYRFGDHIIVGATARMLDSFLGLLATTAPR